MTMPTAAEIAAEEARVHREFVNVADEMWEADERARFDAEANAIADRFEEG